MTIFNTIFTELSLMLRISGRLNRLRYLTYGLFTSVLLDGLDRLNTLTNPNITTMDLSGFISALSVALLSIPLVIFTFIWLKRRINDTGASSKWIWRILGVALISMLIVVVLSLASITLPVLLYTCIILTVISLLIFNIICLVMLFKRGTPGDNKFGPPPPENNYLIKSICLVLVVLFCIASADRTMNNTHKLAKQNQSQQH